VVVVVAVEAVAVLLVLVLFADQGKMTRQRWILLAWTWLSAAADNLECINIEGDIPSTDIFVRFEDCRSIPTLSLVPA